MSKIKQGFGFYSSKRLKHRLKISKADSTSRFTIKHPFELISHHGEAFNFYLLELYCDQGGERPYPRENLRSRLTYEDNE